VASFHALRLRQRHTGRVTRPAPAAAAETRAGATDVAPAAGPAAEPAVRAPHVAASGGHQAHVGPTPAAEQTGPGAPHGPPTGAPGTVRPRAAAAPGHHEPGRRVVHADAHVGRAAAGRVALVHAAPQARVPPAVEASLSFKGPGPANVHVQNLPGVDLEQRGYVPSFACTARKRTPFPPLATERVHDD